MIEIVFGDSALGSLKAAQHYGQGECLGGCVSVIAIGEDGSAPTPAELERARQEAEERERQAWEQAVPLGGNPEDVYGFPLGLSMGDISGDCLGLPRRQALERLWGIDPDGRQRALEILGRAVDSLRAVQARAGAGEDLRIWYSDQPDELCGLYWLMAQLRPLEARLGRLYLVKLPHWEAREPDTITQMTSWGEISPGAWGRYLPLQQLAPPLFCRMCAGIWRTLQEENAPLRAVLNGRLSSMPETLYDSFILRELSSQQETFQEARLIGGVLGKHQLGIGDAWLALRIEEMIRAGTLEVVTQPPADGPVYRRVLKKAKL